MGGWYISCRFYQAVNRKIKNRTYGVRTRAPIFACNLYKKELFLQRKYLFNRGSFSYSFHFAVKVEAEEEEDCDLKRSHFHSQAFHFYLKDRLHNYALRW